MSVDLVVNGEVADSQEMETDGSWNDVNFGYRLGQSAWVALSMNGSAHTNPIFVELNTQPILVKKSAEWCRKAVDQCWEMKNGKFRQSEKEAARKGYDHAREVYDRMIAGAAL